MYLSDEVIAALPDRFRLPAQAERRAQERVRALASDLAEAGELVWDIGDGYGGWVRQVVDEAFRAHGLATGPAPDPDRAAEMRRKIPAARRRRVFERDTYRCCVCQSWMALVIDHILPVSLGGGSEEENLQTLCADCNRAKAAG